MTYLGIDLGTSAVKAVLVDDRQRVLASGDATLEVDHPRPHWSEQSPHAWWNAALDAIAAVRTQSPAGFEALRGIGLTGQMHGATLLDAELQPLRPAILWNDTRAHAECREIEAAVPDARAISGNLMMPGFTAPKLLWVGKNEPEVFERVCKVVLPKDYIALCLSGELICDKSDASGTGWLDVAGRAWSDRLLGATSLTRGHMPRLVEGTDRAAELRGELRREWGIGHPVWIAGGAGDNAAAAIGMGICEPGRAMLSLGTSGVVFAGNDSFLPNPGDAVHAFCHCVPGRWHQMSVILSAAASLGWLATLSGRPARQLALEAETASPEQAPLFLPYLSGERTPHNDPNARGVFFGLTDSHRLADLAYSVMEGVAFAIADGCDALRRAGSTLDEASFVGGGSRSRFWAQLCATATGLTMHCHEDSDIGGAFGASRLARVAVTREAVDQVCTLPAVLATFAPEARARAPLHDRWQRYRRLYRVLKPEFELTS